MTVHKSPRTHLRYFIGFVWGIFSIPGGRDPQPRSPVAPAVSSSYATGAGASVGTGNYQISIGAVGGTNGTYFQHLNCRLPASSYLYGYWVDES